MSSVFPYCAAQRFMAEAIFALCLVLSSVLFGQFAYAVRPDSEQPVYVQADRWTYDDLKQVNVLTGRVIITKGKLTIKGDRVIVKQDAEGYQSMTSYAEGRENLAYFRQELNGAQGYIEGYGKQIDYNSQSEVTTLTRRAMVRRRLLPSERVLDEVSGSVISYDGQKERYWASAGHSAAEPGQAAPRVRAMLSPHNAARHKTLSPADPNLSLGTSSPIERKISQ
ncbi:lipopolysaccharide transport periplasmic protein LptA [Mycoavidus sp. SF9855]|uniref:lipopolysaccharide transport periplasmic protein LptA n=1 Tax=Mycoavidus sp. SF9855 TaxID=2968475 RepID=UPI00211C0282|nr:lipopolysaccharide transport periplasmic protein LptA [Mycoavidus sp. SF9855]UUM21236.1 lipopolysaccharide transport periplasmic protein LptA [Mycoavidus sp. SF9855]